jgi:hypothetical protein
MKLNGKQIIASAAGAVLAAVLASLFSVKGTIVGVAIGSAVATSGTAIFASSIERGHKVVRQVVIKNPNAPFLRQFGQTEPVGAVAREDAEGPTTAVEQVTGPGTPPTTATATPETGPAPGTDGPASGPRTFRLPVLAGSIVGVFVLSLVVVTCVELVAGQPLSALFGASPHATGTSLFGNPAPATTVPVIPSTTTTMTAPAGASTTTSTSGGTGTTAPLTPTTSTSTTTTTSAPAATTSTTGP